MLESMKGWRTVAFNIAMGGIAAGVLLGKLSPNNTPSEMQVHQILDAAQGVIDAAWAGINVALRAITNTPIFKAVHPDTKVIQRNHMTEPLFRPPASTAAP